jgi:hypothetical protein
MLLKTKTMRSCNNLDFKQFNFFIYFAFAIIFRFGIKFREKIVCKKKTIGGANNILINLTKLDCTGLLIFFYLIGIKRIVFEKVETNVFRCLL